VGHWILKKKKKKKLQVVDHTEDQSV